MKKIIIAGGAGFLGQVLACHFQKKNWEVVVLSRTTTTQLKAGRLVIWDGRSLGPWTNELEGSDVLVNLSGKSVDCRYTARNRSEILSSRIDPTHVLNQSLQNLNQAPKVWLNAASATIYRHSIDEPMDEATGELGDGFSVQVCKNWESEFFKAELPKTRRVALRTSMVLGHGKNSVYPVLARIARLGIGGKMSSGKQMVSWIHETDFARAVAFAIEEEDIEGPLNVTAPAPVANSVFMRTLREAVRVSIGLPSFRPLLELAAWILRTETELTLKSRYAIPTKLLQHRFVFNYPFLDAALTQLSQKVEPVLQAERLTTIKP